MSGERFGETEGYELRLARPADIEGARKLMFDTFYLVMGYGYVPRWHADVINIRETYLQRPDHALFVAVDDEQIVGTAGVRAGGPKSPPCEAWLAERYADAAQLARVYVDPAHRRRGIARALVERACAFIADSHAYDSIYLHTDPAIEGAEPFWRDLAKEVHDERGEPGGNGIIHFEIPMSAA